MKTLVVDKQEGCKYCAEYEDLPEHIAFETIGKIFDTSIDFDDNGYHICLPSGADIGIKYCPYCGSNLNQKWIDMKRSIKTED